MASRIRVISKYDAPDVGGTNWVNELGTQGITLRTENAESLTLNEVAGKVTSQRNEGKQLTLKRALEMGVALGVQSLSELHANVPGSYQAHLKAIDTELAKSLPKGIDGTMSSYTRVAAALGAFPDEVLLKITSPGTQGMETKYYLVPTSLSKEGAVIFGDAEEIDIKAQFTPHIKDFGKGKSNKDKVSDKEAEHEKLLARDQSFFEAIDRKRDFAEKRERLPRVLGQLTGEEFHTGIKNAVVAQAAPNIAIGKIISELSLGTRSLSAIPTEDFKEVYDLARENAGEIGDAKFIGACDVAMKSDQIFACGEAVAGGESHNMFIRSHVLKRAVENAKIDIESQGGFFVYSTHAVAVAQNGEDPEQAVAVVKIIEFCEKTGAVKLPQIEFIGGSDGGARIVELAKNGKNFGISARFAHGGATVHRGGLYGENVCLELEKVKIRGFDIVSHPSLGMETSFLYWL